MVGLVGRVPGVLGASRFIPVRVESNYRHHRAYLVCYTLHGNGPVQGVDGPAGDIGAIRASCARLIALDLAVDRPRIKSALGMSPGAPRC